MNIVPTSQKIDFIELGEPHKYAQVQENYKFKMRESRRALRRKDGPRNHQAQKITIQVLNEVTLAQALAALKSAKVQDKSNIVEEPSESITTTPTLTTTTTTATTIIANSKRPKAKGLV
ncbi:hypothetical protein Tco_0415613 [Tanacetum coccineum]